MPKSIRHEAEKLDVYVDASQIYEYLSKICNPTNFIGKLEEFEIANNLYQRLVNANMAYEVLEDIMNDAHVAKLDIIEEEIPIVKKPLTKSTIIFLLCCRFIDKKAKVIIPYQFLDCGSFRGGLAYFKKWGTTYDIEGYINKKGEVVWQTKCEK